VDCGLVRERQNAWIEQSVTNRLLIALLGFLDLNGGMARLMFVDTTVCTSLKRFALTVGSYMTVDILQETSLLFLTFRRLMSSIVDVPNR
jgi:hypothetical protein